MFCAAYKKGGIDTCQVLHFWEIIFCMFKWSSSNFYQGWFWRSILCEKWRQLWDKWNCLIWVRLRQKEWARSLRRRTWYDTFLWQKTLTLSILQKEQPLILLNDLFAFQCTKLSVLENYHEILLCISFSKTRLDPIHNRIIWRCLPEELIAFWFHSFVLKKLA